MRKQKKAQLKAEDTENIKSEEQNHIEQERELNSENQNSENAREQAEQEKSSEERTYVAPEEEAYTTTINDPDLLVGPYKPEEGKPLTVKCPNCGEEMPTTIDTCVNCGHYLKKDEKRYVPMSEKKVKRIRWIITVICLIGFVLIMIFTGKWGGN